MSEGREHIVSDRRRKAQSGTRVLIRQRELGSTFQGREEAEKKKGKEGIPKLRADHPL